MDDEYEDEEEQWEEGAEDILEKGEDLSLFSGHDEFCIFMFDSSR